MSWAYGVGADGREVGYSVEAACDSPKCGAEIHRGLAYICGSLPDSQFGCAGFFCYEHLVYVSLNGHTEQVCRPCQRRAYSRREHTHRRRERSRVRR